MSDQAISEEKRSEIIEAIGNGDKTQAEIAEDNDVSQSTVSNIKTGMDRGREEGREEGIEEGKEKGYSEAMSFMKEDNTEKPDEDEYWCAYCEKEDGNRVEVDYMAEECPEGHDLSDDW